MSYNIGQICNGPQIQDLLQNHFRTCSPHSMPYLQDMGTLLYLTSKPNMDSAMQDQLSRNGQNKTVEVIWMQRAQISETTASCTMNCEGGEKEGTNCQQYRITECREIHWTVDPLDWDQSELPVGVWFTQQLQSKLNALTASLNREVVIDISANFGNFSNDEGVIIGTGPVVTQTATPTTFVTETSHRMIEDVTYNSLNSGYCTTPTVLGWGEAYKYIKRINAGCCVPVLGLDNNLFASQNPLQFIPDRTIETILGVNHFVSLDLGAAQVFTWNRFSGDLKEVNDQSYFQRIIVDPVTGLSFDFIGKIDCGVWSFQLMIHYLTAFAPDDSFQVGDPNFNVNGVQHYLINNV